MSVTPDLVETHIAPVLARLRAVGPLADLVFEGDAKGDPEMFVNVYHDTGFFAAHAYVDLSSDVTVTFTIHSIGRDRWQAVWASGQVTAQLLDFRPVIAGRRSHRIKSAGSQPVRKDTTIDPPKFLAVDRFTLHTTPA